MADNKSEKKDDFVIPKDFLERLGEFANGGFILLTFSRNGNPVVHNCYETRKDQLALEAALFQYVEDIERGKFEEETVEDEEEDD